MWKRLYSIQPKECRLPLEIKTINPKWSKIEKRLFLFDPTKIYDILDKGNLLNPLLRRHSVPFGKIFPDDKYGKCACGCGQILSGRRRRWNTDECRKFATYVFSIISGYTDVLRHLRSRFVGGYFCEVCGKSDVWDAIELDHIYPVKWGGGGGWLSNYEFKCKKCHRDKTNRDFGYKEYKNNNKW